MNRRADPPWIWPHAAYVHVPFCAHHCGYCDFAVAAGRDHLMDDYVAAVEQELRSLGAPQPVQTLFLGGGTPTHLTPSALRRFLQTVTDWLPLEPDGEFTVEANPDTTDDERVAILAEHGVTRVSLGVQSFRPDLLRVLERQHDPEQVPRAVERLRRYIPEVSLDLIFGVPGQTLRDWQADLDAALALRPDHVSTYGLTYETGTRLWKQRERGGLQALAEETERDLYEAAMDTLGSAGFEHYEISNFARPGMPSRHNQVYWANHAYFGVGVGAARYVEGRRELNIRSLENYLQRLREGRTPTFQSEELAPEDRARETVALQLRRAEGIHRADFRQQTGHELDPLLGEALPRTVELGLLEDDPIGVRLTRAGKFVADAVITRLL